MELHRETFRQRLIETRLRRGMEQKDLAMAAGLTRPTIWGLEAERKAARVGWPTAPNLYRLARALNVSPEYLMGFTQQPRPWRYGNGSEK